MFSFKLIPGIKTLLRVFLSTNLFYILNNKDFSAINYIKNKPNFIKSSVDKNQ
jgi:hypothetical protein